MKKLSRMLLIYWYTYSREVIEFGDINFLTGKTASGKSTIIDALQLVLLGDTNGNFFNKAANEKSVRTLRGYLFGEVGDDGDTGFRYLRKGPFTSYVVLEFEDTQKKSKFLTGIVCDCYEDLNYDSKWFTVDKSGLPDDLFTDPKTNTPYDIKHLKSRLRAEKRKSFDFIDTNKRFQEVILAKYGSVKRKYLVLLKKAVPFSPITDIEKFITESVCDVKNNIQVEEMQSDIRQYKNLESEAQRIQRRIDALTEIENITKEYETEKERYLRYSYVLLRADKEELLTLKENITRKIEDQDTIIKRSGDEIRTLSEDLTRLKAELETLEEEYHSSDIVRRQKTLLEKIREKENEIAGIRKGISLAVTSVNSYGKRWSRQAESMEAAGMSLPEDSENAVSGMKTLSSETVREYDFESASKAMNELQSASAQYKYELEKRLEQVSEQVKELETRIANLKQGIKPYPQRVMALKRKLEAAIFNKYKRSVEIPLFADLLEIRDPQWRDAIEGYLDRQKFNLLVPEEYYSYSNIVYNSSDRKEKIFDAGLVDIGKLRKEYRGRPDAGSLAEEIETDYPDARLYADFLLGKVMKCEDVEELNRYRIAITKNVMLYKGYVSRRLNPARYADPFIGRRSMQILLENCEKELESSKMEYARTDNNLRIAGRAASCEVMSAYEASQHSHAVARGAQLEELEEKLAALNEEYEGLDFTYLSRMEEQIKGKKADISHGESRLLEIRDKLIRAESDRDNLSERELPDIISRIESADAGIRREYSEEWIQSRGEPAFAEALKKDRKQLTLKESSVRSKNRAANAMAERLKERRRKRSDYNQEYRMPYDTEREDNDEYGKELRKLSENMLPSYLDQIKDAREKAYSQFRDDFIAKLKSNIESVRQQIGELNDALKGSVFGTDSYHFVVAPRAQYKNYYDMITDPLLMDTGGWNIASESFNAKYSREIDSLFKALIINETDVSSERRAEYERNIRKFTDYKTYLVFDLIVTNDQGEKQRLSRTLLKKSGGETQIPFYIALLASFSQVCRIRSKGKDNTIRLIILDEAFSKMDGERIQESIILLRRFGLQAIFSAPPEKIPDIAPNVDRNIAVYRTGHDSFTRHFDPAQIEEIMDETE